MEIKLCVVDAVFPLWRRIILVVGKLMPRGILTDSDDESEEWRGGFTPLQVCSTLISGDLGAKQPVL